MNRKKSDAFIHRITQLDAYEFDREIHSLLMNNIREIGKYMKPGFMDTFLPEIDLLLKLIVFKYSVLQSNSTFGQQFLSAEFDKKVNGQRAAIFSLLNHFIPYLKQKYEDASLNWNNNKVKKIMDRFEIFIKVCQFLNILIFLKNGIFPTLADRILGLKIVPVVHQPRNVGYDYMTRELIWHGFMELFMYVLPLIDYGYIKRKIANIFPSNKEQLMAVRNISYDAKTTCIICGEQPVYPCRISTYCKHVACYYCIKSNTLGENEYICSSCGVKSTAHADVEFLNLHEEE